MNYIKPYIYMAGYRMQDISAATGINKVRLSRISNNRLKPKPDEIVKIFHTLKRRIPDITLEQIFPEFSSKFKLNGL